MQELGPGRENSPKSHRDEPSKTQGKKNHGLGQTRVVRFASSWFTENHDQGPQKGVYGQIKKGKKLQQLHM